MKLTWFSRCQSRYSRRPHGYRPRLLLLAPAIMTVLAASETLLAANPAARSGHDAVSRSAAVLPGLQAATGPDSGNAIAVDGQGFAYITGSWWTGSTTTVFVAKFDPNCNMICVNALPTFAAGPDSGNGIAVDVHGLVYITGSVTTAATTVQAFVQKFDPFCNPLCPPTLLPPIAAGPDIGKAIAVDIAGNAYATGSMTNAAGITAGFVAKVDPFCNLLCINPIPTLVGGPDSGNGIAVDFSGNNVYVTGSLTNAGGTTSAFADKFGPACNFLCQGLVPSLVGGPDVGNGIAMDASGNAYVGGTISTPGTTNAFAAKFDPNCTWLCTGVLPTFAGGPDVGKSIAVNADGFGYLAGAFTIGATTNGFVANFLNCNFNCALPIPTVAGGPDAGNGLAMQGAGNAYITGSMFNGAFTDAFVETFASNCNPLCPPTILPNPN